jgi:hypothetical protein
VGINNSDSVGLPIGVATLIDEDGRHSYDTVKFYGEKPGSIYTADVGQRHIVLQVHGSDENITGNNNAIEIGLQLASARVMSVGTIGDGTPLTVANVSRLKSELDENRWVVANVYKNIGGIGHSVVIKSYNHVTDVYVYWDPWTNETGWFSGTDINNSTIRLLSAPAITRKLTWYQYCSD